MNGTKTLIFILLAIALGACNSRLTIRLAGAEHATPPREFRAGAAKVDITPLPGVPLGGFGEAAKVGRGNWMPLYARAVYFEDSLGRQLAMVICDLWSMPSGLANRVADIVQDTEPGRSIARDEIIVAATHTHSSPAHFSSHVFYNSHSSPDEGFDHELYDFLAHRIAAAIIQARRSATRAEVRLNRVRVDGVARNRSFGAFLRDHDYHNLLTENEKVPASPPPNMLPFPIDTDSYRAVNPYLTLLRVDAADAPSAAPIAVVGFFPVHNTAMGPGTEVYTGDVFGVATTMAEQSLRGNASASPVVALFNSAEGDISPNWYQHDRRNTLRLGEMVASKICSGSKAATERIDGPIVGQYDVVSLRSRRVQDSSGALAFFPAGHDQDGRIEHATDDRATVGVATLGGGEDGWTTFHDLGYVEGVNAWRLAGRGSKETELTLGTISRPINKLLNVQATITTRGVPDEAPLGVYSIGPFIIATLPGEVTTMLGRRISDRISAVTGRKDVALVGLANEYISYFTTPEEYDVQDYEGAATLYGPASGPLLEVELARLARDLTSPVGQSWQRAYRYEPGGENNFTMARIGAAPWSMTEGLANIVQEVTTGRPRHDYPQLVWTDRFWRLPSPEHYSDVTRGVNPLVKIETLNGSTWEPLRVPAPLACDGAGAIEEDNTGLDFVTFCLSANHDASKWGAIWMYPKGIDPTKKLRFNVLLSDGSALRSCPFTLGDYLTASRGPIIGLEGGCP